MNRLAMFPLHITLVFVVALINNMALTSPQVKKGNGMPPNLQSVPETSFTCDGRTAGYYADTEAYCQAYHMCDTQERQYSYLCPGFTLFNQKFMVCDHWHAVNCSIATQYYDLNYNIGRVPGANEVEDVKPIKQKNKETNVKTSISKLDRLQESFAITTSKSISFARINKTPEFVTVRKATPKSVTIRPTTFESITLRPATFESVTIRPLLTQNPLTDILPPEIFSSALPTTTTTQTPPFRQVQTTEKSSFFPFGTILNSGSSKRKHPFFSARGSGQKLKFGQSKFDSDEDTFIEGVKFRPLLKKKKNSFFDERNFTIPPEILAATPSALSVEEVEDPDTSSPLQPAEPLTPFLVPPLTSSVQDAPRSQNARLLPISTILVPPPKAPVILQGDNQEIRTPLILSRRIQPPLPGQVSLPLPQSHITPPRYPFSRGNRDFYIPSPGLIAPLPGNSILEEIFQGRTDEERHHALHHMTMRFPTRISSRKRPLRLNPECPQCHPAFLRANQCQPCVIIK